MQALHHFIELNRAAVLAIGSHGVEIIDRAQNARPDRDFVALKPVGVTAAVVFLVVCADNRHNRIGKTDALQNLRSHHRVNLHLLELFRSKPARLRNDVFGDREFANVVQQGGRLQSLHLLQRDSQIFRDFHRIHPHALQVVVRRVVLRLDGQRQGFDGAHVEIRHLLNVTLFILQLGKIEAIRAVNEIYRGQHEQRGLPFQ